VKVTGQKALDKDAVPVPASAVARVTATFPLWADNPADRDLLGFEDVAGPVSETVVRDRLDPVAVGLIGPWGSGKSTILGLLAKELKRDTTVAVVTTRPWEYDPALDPKATLIGEVLAVIRPLVEAEEGTAGKLHDLASKMAKRVRWTKAFTLAAKTAVTLQLPNWDALEGLINTDGQASEVSDPTLAGFRQEFEEFVSSSKTVTRVVVLVDDLDRCLPPTVISILESIKLFLAVPKMAFVIAYDEAPVVDAIKERYLESDNRSAMAKQYLEKIVQIPVRVPNLGLAATEAYLGLMLIQQQVAPEEFEKLAVHADQRRKGGHPPYLADYGVTLDGEAQAALSLAAVLAPVLYGFLEGNPRRLKRFLNAFWIRSSIASARQITLDPAALAKLMVLEELYRDRFAEVVTWSAEGLLHERLRKLESDDGAGGEAWARPELSLWARLRPPLADLDLVPYIQLAASLSQLTFTASGLSADLQEVLGRLTSDADAPRKAASSEAAKRTPEERQLLLAGVVDAIRREPRRQGKLGDTFADLVGTQDDVAKPLVERLEAIDPRLVEASLITWLRPMVTVPAVNAFLARVRDSGRYETDVTGAARRLLEPPRRS
jgi:energy-coupling factor transporter ATP-binding protein EcfA2